MKTFCPNCEKETENTLLCEIYSCHECDEEYENYEKPLDHYWKTQSTAVTNHIKVLTSFLLHIMDLGLLRVSPRLTRKALELLDAIEKENFDNTGKD
jgi:hypothetical protein